MTTTTSRAPQQAAALRPASTRRRPFTFGRMAVGIDRVPAPVPDRRLKEALA